MLIKYYQLKYIPPSKQRNPKTTARTIKQSVVFPSAMFAIWSLLGGEADHSVTKRSFTAEAALYWPLAADCAQPPADAFAAAPPRTRPKPSHSHLDWRKKIR